MGYSLNLCASEATRGAVVDLWDAIGRIEGTSSMQALGYPPHITLAIYDAVDRGAAEFAFACCVGCGEAMRLRFGSIRSFAGPPMVLWLAPEPDERLARVHAAAHGAIDPGLCRAHYRPGRWTPHCTLGNRIGADGERAAAEMMTRFAGEVSVVFDALDYVSFPPLRRVLRHRWDQGDP